ncbi:hypothetical protein AGMMS50239_34580 [Bacteroidia bacterium]|nr:hypothetical protein AGMMS50239_34580 [Bacteroidia bacterium]
MKRRGYIFEQIIDMDNLRLAFYKAQQGKSAKKDVLQFCENLDSNLLAIRNGLLNENYRFGSYHYFMIYDPKCRVICAASFEERVIHHAIMNICSTHFENYQIPYSYACRKNKGTFAAIEKAAYYQKKYAWYLKLDVRKYFDSIDHEILFDKLKLMYKDKRLLDMFWQIIDSYHAQDGKGLPIGNLTSQYFANHYLSFADKQATEQLRIPAYVRYMDDMLLWSDDKTELMEKGILFERFIAQNLQLSLKPFIINKTEHGLPALGFLLYPNQIRLNRRSKKRFVTKLTGYTNLLNTDSISEKQFAQCTLSLYGFISHANSKGFATQILQEIGLNTKGSNRVNRGGRWNNDAQNVRVPNRNNNTPDNRNSNIGFRLASITKQQQIDFEQVSISFPEKGKNNFSLSGE